MKKLLSIQLPPPRFSFQEKLANIPLAAGFIAQAISDDVKRSFDTEILPNDVTDIFADSGLAEHIVQRNPDVLMLTLYLWNAKRSLALASRVKQMLPHVRVIVGGPEVTFDQEWLLKNSVIDVGVVGEGESRISDILESLYRSNCQNPAPGTFVRNAEHILCNRDEPASYNLTNCKDPYTLGLITPESWEKLYVETARGCRFRCRYCYYHKAFSAVKIHPKAEYEAALSHAYKRDAVTQEIYLMDPTFNALPHFREVLSFLVKLRKKKDIALHAELRADLLTKEDVLLLKNAGLKSAEVGLQSIHKDVLKIAGRSHDLDKIERGIHLLKSSGIQVITGVIAGLPGDSPQGFLETLSWLKEKETYDVVHPFVLSILPGTDFRFQAKKLNIEFDPEPPYFVRSTPTFSWSDIETSLQIFENMFSQCLNVIEIPALENMNDDNASSVFKATHLQKWVCKLDEKEVFASELPYVIKWATDPFIIVFRSSVLTEGTEEAMSKILKTFLQENPYCVLDVVIEFPKPPKKSFFLKIVQESAMMQHYLNRFFEPLYGKGRVLTINFTLLLTGTYNQDEKASIETDYEPFAAVSWKTEKKTRG